jgi:hypothetical protein
MRLLCVTKKRLATEKTLECEEKYSRKALIKHEFMTKQIQKGQNIIEFW